MMLHQETSLGKVFMDPDVVALIAGAAAVECYGLVGMHGAGLQQGLSHLLRKEDLARGVVVTTEDGTVAIDLYVVVQYGVNIVEVSHNVMEQVRYAVEGYCGLDVTRVNVHVEGVRVDDGLPDAIAQRRRRRGTRRR